MNRAEQIDFIVDAARKPCPQVVKSIHPKIGFVYRTPDGSAMFCHKPGGFATAADAVADHEAREDANAAEFRTHLEAMDATRLQSQFDYWTKQAAKAARLGR